MIILNYQVIEHVLFTISYCHCFTNPNKSIDFSVNQVTMVDESCRQRRRLSYPAILIFLGTCAANVSTNVVMGRIQSTNQGPKSFQQLQVSQTVEAKRRRNVSEGQRRLYQDESDGQRIQQVIHAVVSSSNALH
jgi:hypothetical protein